MAWLESHGNLARHPKTRRLMQRMGWTLPHTIGNLHLLWYWALEYAPTGDLTKFDHEDLTHDLDLGEATPEQFIQALVDSGFLDRRKDNTLRLHDWPDYTKSLRPKFRRDPEKWHDVLRSYNRPIPPRRQRGTPALPASQPFPVRAGEDASLIGPPRRKVPEQVVPSSAVRDDQMVGKALRAVPRENPSAVAESEHESIIPPSREESLSDQVQYFVTETADSPDEPSPVNLGTAQQPESEQAPIPKCLSGRRNFNDWWRKLQEHYKNKGCPLRTHEQTEVLAMLARNPFTAVEKLQYSVVNFETSFAKLPTLGGNRPPNTS